MKGFTLVELIVVLAILFTVSGAAMLNIVEFQKNSTLTAATQELLSTLRIAQTNSIAGQVNNGESVGTFQSTGLPYFGVKFTGNSYQLIRRYTASGAGSETESTVDESHSIDSSLTVTLTPILGSTPITFSRISGIPSTSLSVEVKRSNGTKKTITVNSSGLITL